MIDERFDNFVRDDRPPEPEAWEDTAAMTLPSRGRVRVRLTGARPMTADFTSDFVRMTCPDGHVWTGKTPTTDSVRCPRCFETFDAEDVDQKPVKTPKWADELEFGGAE